MYYHYLWREIFSTQEIPVQLVYRVYGVRMAVQVHLASMAHLDHQAQEVNKGYQDSVVNPVQEVKPDL